MLTYVLRDGIEVIEINVFDKGDLLYVKEKVRKGAAVIRIY